MVYTYSVHDHVTVEADIDCYHDYFETTAAVDPDTPSLTIRVHDDVPAPPDPDLAFGNEYTSNDDHIHYKKRFMGQEFELMVEDLSGDHTTFHISKKHIDRVKIALPMTDLYAFNHYFRALLFVKLVQNDLALIHSSCVEIDGQGLMFTGFPDTGKTLTAIRLIEEFDDSRLLSDDLNLGTEQARSYTYEPVSSVSVNTAAESSLADGEFSAPNLRKKANDVLKYLTYLPYFPDTRDIGVEMDLSENFSEKLTDTTTVDRFYFLEYGPTNGVEPISAERALDKLISICERELYFLNSNNVVLASSYADDELSYYGLKNSYHEILERFLHEVETYVVQVTDPTRFPEQVKRTIDG